MRFTRYFLLLFGITLMILGYIGFTNARYASAERTVVAESFAATPGTPIPAATLSVVVPTGDVASATPITQPEPTAEPTQPVSTDSGEGTSGEDVPIIIPPVLIVPPNPNYGYSYSFSAIGIHVVQPGETLFCIGRAYYVNPLALGQANGIRENDTLLPGRSLAVPNAPWNNIIPGRVCVPQFASPYVPTPTPVVPTPTVTVTATATPTPTVTNADDDQSQNSERNTLAPQVVMTETRKILVSLPKNMVLGESLELTLTFNPEDLGTADGGVSVTSEPTALPTPDSKRQVSPPTFSDLRYYEDYLLYATARLDAPGFHIASANEERRLVQAGEEIVYRWSIQPIEAENQTLIVSLWLDYEPMHADMEPLSDGMYWNASYVVEVTQTLFGLTARTLQTTSFLAEGFGLVSVVISLFPRRKEEDE